jgi:drug/metabolite transporter (DMT)-like permease
MSMILDFLPMTAFSIVASSISKVVKVPSMTWNIARTLSAGVIVSVFVLFNHSLFPKISSGQWVAASVSGMLMFAVMFLYIRLLRKYGIGLTTSISNALAIIAGIAAGVLWFSESLTRPQILGAAFIITGLVMMNISSTE